MRKRKSITTQASDESPRLSARILLKPEDEVFFLPVPPSSLVAPRTVHASIILSLAMITALLYNYIEVKELQQANDVHEETSLLWKLLCDEVVCHPQVSPFHRSQQAIGEILTGETIVSIPRHMLILDVDALQDEFVVQEFADKLNNSQLTGAAFLALHLARLRQEPAHLSPFLQQYLRTLPLDFDYHPVSWNSSRLERLLGFTSAFDHVRQHQELIRQEYDLFATISSRFSSQIPFNDYKSARLAVLTRSFGTNIAADSEPERLNVDEFDVSRYAKDLYQLQSSFSVDLSSGSFALVPILDLYDHYAIPNVAFGWKRGAFQIIATQPISAKNVLFDSYGRRTDSDLLARYGFIQGDGTDYTETSIAMHRLDFSPKNHQNRRTVLSQRARILRYLQYDDGYPNCITKNDGPAWELKQLKYQYLLQRADLLKQWALILSPRVKNPKPPANLFQKPDAEDLPRVNPSRPPQINSTAAFSTCRIISLIHTDYDGQAINLVKNIVNNTDVHALPVPRVLNNATEALEYRTSLCMVRMIASALQRLNTTAYDKIRNVRQYSRHSIEWNSALVILGELQTLQYVKDRIHQNLRSRFRSQFEHQMRLQPCPKNTLDPLFSHVITAEHTVNYVV